jgi:two-component system KDP operon response regulator KdpE
MSAAPFTIDLTARVVTVDGRRVHLTPIEWGIVELLVRHPDRLVTHDDLLRSVWGEGVVDRSGFLRVHVAAIRRKLEPDPHHPRFFLTEPRLGYRCLPDA